MNLSEDQIDHTLRRAPCPRPPAGLHARLRAGVVLPQASAPPDPDVIAARWLRRWWPALTAGGLAVGALAVVVVQQSQIRQLEEAIQTLEKDVPPPQSGPALPSPAVPPSRLTVPLANGAAELEALRSRTGEMAAEVKTLEGLQAENDQLRAAAAAALGIESEQLRELEQAKANAQSITCINNLKQLGLAARVWATDNRDVLPPDLLSMSNEIAAPKILVCPADSGRQPATDWASFTPANASYEFLAANCPEIEPSRVAFRCPIHGHVGLVDGSVQGRVAKEHPDWIVPREGKLYLESPAQPVNEAPGPTPNMSPEMMKRYGLLPPGSANPPPMDEELMRRYGLQPAPDPNQVPEGPK